MTTEQIELASRLLWTAAFVLAVFGNVLLQSPPPQRPTLYAGLWVSAAACVTAMLGTAFWVQNWMDK